MADKPYIDVVTIGHVDHGKSTLVGRLLLDSGKISKAQVDALEREATARGKTTFGLAYLMDDLIEERERGITIRAQIKQFSTNKYNFNISDAPGHQAYVDNMIRGTVQADAAILVMDAGNGIQPQTKEHLILAKSFGIEQLIVAVNKMDSTSPTYSQDVFDQRVSELSEMLRKYGYSEKKFTFVPVSAYKGDNVVKHSDNMRWYSGRTLVEALDDFTPQPKPVDQPLRWPLRDIMKVTGVGYIPVGYIYSGTMHVGDELVFMPAGKRGRVKTMEVHNDRVQIAYPGDPVGADIALLGRAWNKDKDLRSGDVAGLVTNPPTVADTLVAQILILDHPSEIFVGYAPQICCGEAHIKSSIIEMQKKINPRTLEQVEGEVYSLKNGDLAVVKMKPLLPLIVEQMDQFPKLGRFALRDGKERGRTIGVGRILSVQPRAIKIE